MKKKKQLYISVLLVLFAAAVFELILFSIKPYDLEVSLTDNTYEKTVDIILPFAGNSKEPEKCAYNSLGSEKVRDAYSAIEKTVYYISTTENENNKFNTMPVFASTEQYSEKELHMAATAFFDDNPQVFWCDKSIICSYSESRGTYISAVSLYPAEKINPMIENLINCLLKIVSDSPITSDYYYLEKYVHDSIIDFCRYASPSSAGGLASTAYGCIVEKKANCEGITDGFNLLVKCLGMDTLKIYGNAQGIGLHTWSCVKISNDWYMTDVTWDMRDNPHKYDYFNISTAEISKTHTIEKTYNEVEINNSLLELSDKYYNIFVPECGDLNQSYFAKEGYPVTKKSDVHKNQYLLDYIYRSYKSGINYCALKISTDILSVEEIVDTFFEEDNLNYYNSNIKYRLSDGEYLSITKEDSEILNENAGILVLRF